MVINGTVSRVLFTAGNGFSVILLKTDKGDVKCTGQIPGIHQGMCLSIDGKHTENKYGKQFEIANFQIVTPVEDSDIVAFLGSGLLPGLGKKNAAKLVKLFGSEIFHVLDNFPERILEIKGIGKNKLPDIITAWKEHKYLKEVFQFLAPAGVTKLTAMKIYEIYGDKSIITIRENPYVLSMDVEGFGFLKSDKIALGIQVSPTDPKRIDAAIQYTLMELAEKRGDVYITAKDLYSETARLLSFNSPDLIIERLNTLLAENNPNIATRTINNEVVFYFKQYYDYEIRIADIINKLKTRKTNYDYLNHLAKVLDQNRESGFELGMEQLQGVDLLINNGLACLSGGPGVGKTTVIKTLLNVFDSMGLEVDLIAPTGRAAQRMTEATKKQASTIHRYLFANGGFKDFCVPGNVVIIDESSMVDLKLFMAFIKGVSENTHLIFVGDYNQLPPVGVGDIYRNLVQEDSVPTAKLTTVFRQGKDSGIIKFIHSVMNSNQPVISRVTTPEDYEKDCILLDFKEANRMPKMVELYKKLTKNGDETQIITCKREGKMGVNSINSAIQDAINPAQRGVNEFKRGYLTLREGDKVIQTKNDYSLEVFNGEIGVISFIDTEEETICVQFTDREILFPFENARDLELAYAITVHKSQGSEFKNVIFALYCDAYYMLSLNILMTGSSRAKSKLVIHGEYAALKMCISKGSQSIRKGYISELIKESSEDDVEMVG